MKDYIEDLTQQMLDNTNYRRVVHTGDNMQTVVMCMKSGENFDRHVLPDTEQRVYLFHGQGEATVNGEPQRLVNGDALVIRAGAEHDLVNTGSDDLRMTVVYAPPLYDDGLVHQTKQDGDASGQ